METATTASQLDLMAMAKHGNLDALAALMHRSLQAKGISTELHQAENCLTVTVIASQGIPDKAGLMVMLKRGLGNVQPKGVSRVIVRARAAESKAVAWRDSFALKTEPAIAESPLTSITDKLATLPQVGAAVVQSAREQVEARKAATAKSSSSSVATKPKASNVSRSLRHFGMFGNVMFVIGFFMVITGLNYDATVASGEFGLRRSYNIGAISNKATYTQAGGSMMTTGAVLIMGSLLGKQLESKQ